MKLKDARITEFKSVWDSGVLKVDRVACLVGKNEAGKTGLLEALYRLNPIIPADAVFDATDDYPRAEVENYQQDIESKRRRPATVIRATFLIEQAELDAIHKDFGTEALPKPEIDLWRGYQRDKEGKQSILYYQLDVSEPAVAAHFVSEFNLPQTIATRVAGSKSLKGLWDTLVDLSKEQGEQVTAAKAAANLLTDEAEKAAALETAKGLAESEPAKALRAHLAELIKHESLGLHIWTKYLRPGFPTFMYFDEYYQMNGHDNIEALRQRKTSGTLKASDYPLLGLIDLARLDLDKILSASRTQELKNKLQGASNFLSSQILKYWSQNKHLRMNFDVRPAMAGDPPGMTTGTNIWGEVFDSKHLVSTGLATRSTGFVWFFSFLAWYSAVKKEGRPVVLLLDEPGLSLHGRAQEDLLRYFEAEIVSNPRHQLIYTTHSPFMVNSQRFDRVRIVQDRSIDFDGTLPRDQDGTKVLTDVLEAGPDSLFPLQGALGFDVYQTLFIGPNSLIVEGVSDLLYLQTVSGSLERAGRTGLDSRWTITPVGGAQKVPTFVALIGAQSKINVATLIDIQKGDQQWIENLYKKKLLEKSHVHTYADYTGTNEADIEDMFGDALYLDLVNAEFAAALSTKIAITDLKGDERRLLVRLEEWLATHPLSGGAVFNHYRPARHFSEHVASLQIPTDALNRFEAAFKALNALLPSG